MKRLAGRVRDPAELSMGMCSWYEGRPRPIGHSQVESLAFFQSPLGLVLSCDSASPTTLSFYLHISTPCPLAYLIAHSRFHDLLYLYVSDHGLHPLFLYLILFPFPTLLAP